MAGTNILLDLGTARIKRFDGENVTIEILEKKEAGTYRIPNTGETIEKPDREEWVHVGYFANAKSALRYIYNNDLLIEDKQRTLEEYISINKEILTKLKRFGL